MREELAEDHRVSKGLKGKALLRELLRIARDDCGKYDFAVDESEFPPNPKLEAPEEKE